MKKLTYLFAIVSLLFITSCDNNKLTNEIAIEVISKVYPFHCTSFNRIQGISIGINPDESSSSYNKKMKELNIFKELESQGLIKINLITSGLPSNPHKDYSFELTQKAIKKYNNKIALTSIEFSEIIGISQTENEALVKYKTKSIPTPFYNLQTWSRVDCKESESESEIILVKYDTGWMIKNWKKN